MRASRERRRACVPRRWTWRTSGNVYRKARPRRQTWCRRRNASLREPCDERSLEADTTEATSPGRRAIGEAGTSNYDQRAGNSHPSAPAAMNILVAEDDKALSRMLCGILQEGGHICV